jgi:hypothetical protein
MLLSKPKENICLTCLVILIPSLFLNLIIGQPVFAVPFIFYREYNNGFERLKLSGKFEAKDKNSDGEISVQEVEYFTGIILYGNLKQSENFALFDVIKLGEQIEFDDFKYNLSTKKLQFSLRTTGYPLNSLIETVDSYWHVNFEGQFDLFFTANNGIVGIDSRQTGIAKIAYNRSRKLDGIAVLLILGFILIRINQQIHAALEFDRETASPETW